MKKNYLLLFSFIFLIFNQSIFKTFASNKINIHSDNQHECQNNNVNTNINLVNQTNNCLPVHNLIITNLIGNSACLHWTPLEQPDFFKIVLTNTNNNNTIQYTTTDTFFVLTNLTPNNSYTVLVLPFCLGIFGDSVQINFYTPCIEGGEVTFGNTNSMVQGNVFPFSYNYEYSYTQQLFDASQIGNVDTIYGIAFQYKDTSKLTRNINIYLAKTALNEFLGINSFIPFTSMHQVFQGNFTFSPCGDNWTNIFFSTPYIYHADSNLVLAIYDQTGVALSIYPRFKTHGGFSNIKSLKYEHNGGNINLYDPPSGSYSSSIGGVRSNVKFITPCEVFSCYPPNLIIGNIGSNSCSFNLIPGLNETSWNAEYKRTSDQTWNSLGYITNSNYLLLNLDPMTSYQFRIRNVCSPSDSSSWASISFKTGCGMINQIPYTENFDSYTSGIDSFPDCWNRYYLNLPSPYITGAVPNSAPNSIMFTNNDTTYSYIVLPEVNQTIPINTLQISFKGRMGYGGGTLGENLVIGVMSNPNDLSTFIPVDTLTVTIFSALYYQNFSFPLTSYTGNGNYVAILSDLRNQNNECTFHIDDLVLDYAPTCLPPSNIQISGVTNTSATVHWTPNLNGNAISYQLVYGLNYFNPNTATPVNVSDTFCTITGLSSLTDYKCYVRSVCSGGEVSLWSQLGSFRTKIATPAPYFEPFNVMGYFAPEYYVLNGWGIDSIRGVRGNPPCNLKTNFSQTYGTSNYFQTIDIGPLSDHMELTLDYKFAYFNSPYYPVPFGKGCFYLSISKDFGETYTVVDTVFSNGSFDYQSHRVDLADYNNEFIKIKIVAKAFVDTYMDLGIDNILVADTIVCRKPTELRTDAIYSNSILLGWNENCSASNWVIEYGPSGFTHGNGTIVLANSNPISINNLVSATSYDFYVRSICSILDSSLWSNKLTISLPCLINTIPYVEDFSDSIMPICWSQTYSGNLIHNVWRLYTQSWSGGTPNEMIANYQNEIGISRLISPIINFSGYSNPYLIFKYNYSDDPGNLVFKIQTSADKIHWTDQPFSFSSGSGSTGPTTAVVPLNVSAGNQYFAFVIDGNHFDFMYWIIDDINLVATPLPCLIPSNITVDTISENEATISWTPGCYETQWEIEYLMLPDTIWSTLITTTPYVTIQNLQDNSYYLFRVKAICTNSESDFSQPILVTTFINPTLYTINASSSMHGVIIPSGEIPVTSGESQTFQFIPNNNCQVSSIMIDGTLETNTSTYYTFSNVQSNHTIYVDFITGMEINEMEKAIHLYPNPASTTINLIVEIDILKINSCKLYNIHGQLIKKINIKSKSTLIDVSDLASGVYYIYLETKSNVSLLKFLKK